MLIESYVHKLKLAVDEALAARSRVIICKVNKLQLFVGVEALCGAYLVSYVGKKIRQAKTLTGQAGSRKKVA